MVAAALNVLNTMIFQWMNQSVTFKLRSKLLEKILNAPTSFFDTTP
jgi:ABC-type bacteriocin/lantibiotic exporter with double-glycine peptidase domain